VRVSKPVARTHLSLPSYLTHTPKIPFTLPPSSQSCRSLPAPSPFNVFLPRHLASPSFRQHTVKVSILSTIHDSLSPKEEKEKIKINVNRDETSLSLNLFPPLFPSLNPEGKRGEWRREGRWEGRKERRIWQSIYLLTDLMSLSFASRRND